MIEVRVDAHFWKRAFVSRLIFIARRNSGVEVGNLPLKDGMRNGAVAG